MIEELLRKAQEWVNEQTPDSAREHIRFHLIREGCKWNGYDYEQLTDIIYNEMFGFGPLQPLLEDPDVNDVLVNGPYETYVEVDGKLVLKKDIAFRDKQHLIDLIQRIVAPLGRRFDRSSPFVDARLPDGSRVHAVGEPACLNGPLLAIRRFRDRLITLDELVMNGTCNEQIANFLKRAVHHRCNIVVSGGTGTGKTTTLNALLDLLSHGDERLIIIEDAAELRFHGHAARLESRPPNAEGQGYITIRELLRNALRMRPDRIVVGEVRDGAAWDMLQAMNTGHPGSMTSVHANSPFDCLARIADMILMDRDPPPYNAVARQIGRAIDFVIHQTRLADGRRIVHRIAAIDWDTSGWEMQDVYYQNEFMPAQIQKNTWANKPQVRAVMRTYDV